MIQLSRIVIVAGAAVTFAACSESGPTAPTAAPPAAVTAGDLVVQQAPAPSASCTVTQNGAEYDVTVTWFALWATRIELWEFDGLQPLAVTVLARPRRNGSLTLTLTAAPDYADVTGREFGVRVLCVTGT